MCYGSAWRAGVRGFTPATPGTSSCRRPCGRPSTIGLVPPIPLDVIWPFLIQPRVVCPEDLADAPYVVSSQDEHLTPAETNRIYIRGLPPAEPGTQYTVVRCGEVYRDPPAQRDENTRYATLEPVALRYTEDCIGAEGGALGYEALQVADAVLERAGDPATAVITRSNREVLSGDRLLPLTGAVYPEFVPHAPPRPVAGSVISVLDTHRRSHGVPDIPEGELRPGHGGDASGASLRCREEPLRPVPRV
jgi:hypothetical protein